MDVLDWNQKTRDQVAKQEEDEKMKEYVHQFVEYWENNITNVFTRKKDILVVDSVLEIFRRKNILRTSTRKLCTL